VATPNVQGVAETLEALREFPKATGRNVLRRALVKAAQPVAVVARSYAPDDTATGAPDLKSSIAVATQLTQRQQRTRPKLNEVEVYVGPTRAAGRFVLNYASFKEFGTYKMPAHPYLRPAWDRTQGLVQVIFAKELAIHFEAAAARLSRKFFKLR
jgi:HK97 gp10 family phage protein